MLRIVSIAALVLSFVSCGGAMRAPNISPDTDDQTIAVRIRTALLNDPVVHGNEISVTAHDGVVVFGRKRVLDRLLF